MRYYVTLFDSNYITRGLVMYRSLLKHSEKFHLWIICFDDLAHEILTSLNLKYVTLVSLFEFEDEELLKIKSERTRQEYCWTCTPSTALYILNTEPKVDTITYLDADLMFFSSPEQIFAEVNNASILLTEHRYLPGFDQSANCGIYNVQFMMFKRNSEGLEALNWWRSKCLDWCFARFEDNKFGDQKYLDDWPSRFTGIHITKHLGAGLAPWNAAQYDIHRIDEQIYIDNYQLVFYHFHGLKIHCFNIGYAYGMYPINFLILKWIYHQYFQEIDKAYQEIKAIYPKFNGGIVAFPKPPRRPQKLHLFFRSIIRDIQEGRYFYYV